MGLLQALRRRDIEAVSFERTVLRSDCRDLQERGSAFNPRKLSLFASQNAKPISFPLSGNTALFSAGVFKRGVASSVMSEGIRSTANI